VRRQIGQQALRRGQAQLPARIPAGDQLVQRALQHERGGVGVIVQQQGGVL
jgi:hypothetical protein